MDITVEIDEEMPAGNLRVFLVGSQQLYIIVSAQVCPDALAILAPPIAAAVAEQVRQFEGR